MMTPIHCAILEWLSLHNIGLSILNSTSSLKLQALYIHLNKRIQLLRIWQSNRRIKALTAMQKAAMGLKPQLFGYYFCNLGITNRPQAIEAMVVNTDKRPATLLRSLFVTQMSQK